MLHQSFWPAHRKVGKTPLPSLFMDMLQTPPLSQPKLGYNKNCAIKCDSLPLLLPFLGFFFFFFLYLNKICAPASVPSETYDQVFLELDFFNAVMGAGKSGHGWWGCCAGQPLSFLQASSVTLHCTTSTALGCSLGLTLGFSAWNSCSGDHWGSDTSIWEQ